MKLSQEFLIVNPGIIKPVIELYQNEIISKEEARILLCLEGDDNESD